MTPKLDEVLGFMERESGGLIDCFRARALLTTVVRGPDAIRTAVRGQNIAIVGVFIDTCDNDANSAELLLVLSAGGSVKSEIDSFLDWAELETAKGPRVALDVPIQSAERLPAGWLTARGYHEAYRLHIMQRDGAGPAMKTLPTGFRWESYAEQNLDSYYEAVKLAFREIPGANVPASIRSAPGREPSRFRRASCSTRTAWPALRASRSVPRARGSS